MNDVLRPSAHVESQNKSYNDSIFWVEVDKIRPNPFQPRREFNAQALEDLSKSVRQYGILQPLVVTRHEEEVPEGGMRVFYELIAGERRLKASKMAGLQQVPVVIRTNEESARVKLELAIIENLQREDLTPIDRARAFIQLHDQFGLTHAEIGKRLGKSREYVSNSVRLLTMPQEIMDALSAGQIREGHTRPLMMLRDDPEQQSILLKEIIHKGISVRDAEKIARSVARDKVRRPDPGDDPKLRQLEQKFTENLGTRVYIEKRQQGKGGKVVIDYFSPEELEQILEIMKTNKKQKPTAQINKFLEQKDNQESQSAPVATAAIPEPVVAKVAMAATASSGGDNQIGQPSATGSEAPLASKTPAFPPPISVRSKIPDQNLANLSVPKETNNSQTGTGAQQPEEAMVQPPSLEDVLHKVSFEAAEDNLQDIVQDSPKITYPAPIRPNVKDLDGIKPSMTTDEQVETVPSDLAQFVFSPEKTAQIKQPNVSTETTPMSSPQKIDQVEKESPSVAELVPEKTASDYDDFDSLIAEMDDAVSIFTENKTPQQPESSIQSEAAERIIPEPSARQPIALQKEVPTASAPTTPWAMTPSSEDSTRRYQEPIEEDLAIVPAPPKPPIVSTPAAPVAAVPQQQPTMSDYSTGNDPYQTPLEEDLNPPPAPTLSPAPVNPPTQNPQPDLNQIAGVSTGPQSHSVANKLGLIDVPKPPQM